MSRDVVVGEKKPWTLIELWRKAGNGGNGFSSYSMENVFKEMLTRQRFKTPNFQVKLIFQSQGAVKQNETSVEPYAATFGQSQN